MKFYKIILIVILLASNLLAEVSVTVNSDFKTSPQIYVNDEVVRPRMFWGTARGGNIETDEMWKEFSFDVTASFDANATLHFRFGKFPGEVWLKNIQIKNAETGRIVFPNNTFLNENSFKNSWNVYPPDERNTVGNIEFVDSCFHVILSEPPVGES